MTRSVLACALLLCASPADDLRAQTENAAHVEVSAGSLGAIRLELGGWIQFRWEHEVSGTDEFQEGFSLTRARLDLKGEAIDGAVVFRIQPEFSGTPSLRDAYIEAPLWHGATVRAGQYPVPFQWSVSPKREQLSEGGITQREFGTPTGRDVGILVQGESYQGRVYYAMGLYSGEGLNRRLPSTTGYLTAHRVGFAVAGRIPRDESDWQRTPATQLSLGLGLEAANRNRGREWGEEVDLVGLEADWVTVMADVQLQGRGLSATAEAYWRQVAPRVDFAKSFEGWGIGLSAGYALPTSDPLEGVVRLQRLQRDTQRPGTRLGSIDAGLNLYLRGHALKVRAYGSRIWRGMGVTTDALVTDVNLLVG